MPTSNQPQNTKIDIKTKEKLKTSVQINPIMDRTELNTSCDWYDFEGFNKISINKRDLPAHTDDLKTFLKPLNRNLEIICISEIRLSTKTSLITKKHLLHQPQGVH